MSFPKSTQFDDFEIKIGSLPQFPKNVLRVIISSFNESGTGSENLRKKLEEKTSLDLRNPLKTIKKFNEH